jgi:hypothetical protein
MGGVVPTGVNAGGAVAAVCFACRRSIPKLSRGMLFLLRSWVSVPKSGSPPPI